MKRSHRVASAAVLILLWVGLLIFYTRANTFPYYYHTDEPSKVTQVLADKRNFFHPQLLLIGSGAALSVSGQPRTAQNCVVAGRWTSAAFAAGAVVLLTLLAARLAGWAAGAMAAVFTGLHPLFFELAHYMKEDCAWLFGLAATLLAAAWVERRRTGWPAAVLGAAAGVATSGKYIGVTALLASVAFVAFLPKGNRARLTLAVLGGFAVSFGLVNWLVIIHPAQAYTGLREELGRMRDIAEESSSLIQWRYLQKALKLTWPAPLLPAALTAGWVAWRARHERRAVERLNVCFALGFIALLLFTPRIKERYLLPVVGITGVLAAVGIARAGAALGPRWGRPAMAMAALGAAAVQAPDLAACWRDFHADPRADLVAFLRGQISPDAIIAHDWRTALTHGRAAAPGSRYDFPQPTLEATRYLADLGTLEDFRRWGVRYFVVTGEDYGSVLKASATPSNAALKKRCEAFYGGLFARGKLLWQVPRGRISYVRPDLSVYELD